MNDATDDPKGPKDPKKDAPEELEALPTTRKALFGELAASSASRFPPDVNESSAVAASRFQTSGSRHR